MPRLFLLLLLCLFLPACGRQAASKPVTSGGAALIQPLIDPANLATLGERKANQRVQKVTAILYDATASGQDPAKIADEAIDLIGWGGTDKGRLTAGAMLRNLTILERLGSTTPDDLAAMRRGRAATVRTGPYAGDLLSVDHIIPRSIAPELDNTIANLELMPVTLNQKKGDKIGDRCPKRGSSMRQACLRKRDLQGC